MIKFQTKIKGVERKSRVKSAHKVGDHIETEIVDLGWAILLDGSLEWMFVGDEEPEFKVGDEVEMTIVKTERRR